MLLQRTSKEKSVVKTSLGRVEFGPGGMLDTDTLPEANRDKIIERLLGADLVVRVVLDVPNEEELARREANKRETREALEKDTEAMLAEQDRIIKAEEAEQALDNEKYQKKYAEDSAVLAEQTKQDELKAIPSTSM